MARQVTTNMDMDAATGVAEQTALQSRYRETRAQSLALCAPLEQDDYNLQAEPFTSPPKSKACGR